MADIDIGSGGSLYESVSVAEFTSRDISDLAVNEYDTVAVIDMPYFFGESWLSTYDSTTVTDTLIEVLIAYPPFVYEAVTVTDVETVEIPLTFYIDERWIPHWPVWSIEASFAQAFQSWELKRPPHEGVGYFGAMLDEKAPFPSLDASISVDTEIFSLDAKAPTFSGEGYFGGMLDSKGPHYEITASFEDIYFAVLDRTAPFWSLEAEMIAPLVFSLDKRMPARLLSASMSPESIGMSLDESRAAYKLLAEGYAEPYIYLDERMPVRKLDAAMYSEEMWLDATMPAWVMQVVADGKMGVGTSVIDDKSRFTDYILRYRRP